MLPMHRRFGESRHGLRLDELGLMHSRYRVMVKVRRKVVGDDQLLGARLRPVPGDRSLLVVQLDGEQAVRRNGTLELLREGQVLQSRRNEGIGLRHEGDLRVLIIEWEPGLLGTRLLPLEGPATLSPAALRALRAHVDRFTEEDVEVADAADSLAQTLAILRAEGLPIDPLEAKDLVEPVSPTFRALSRAVDRALSSQGDRPAVVDLEQTLGWSRSRIHRTLKEFLAAYAFQAVGGWRELYQAWRIPLATAVMGAGVRTEEAAAMLGYASPVALCNSFAKFGLPSPGAIPDALRRLA